jgi:hypothetical protein
VSGASIPDAFQQSRYLRAQLLASKIMVEPDHLVAVANGTQVHQCGFVALAGILDCLMLGADTGRPSAGGLQPMLATRMWACMSLWMRSAPTSRQAFVRWIGSHMV